MIFTNEIKMKARNIVLDLMDTYPNFKDYINRGCPYGGELWAFLKDITGEVDGFHACAGASKLVFYFEDMDFVIKTDTRNNWIREQEHYCHNEYKTYKAACEAKLDDYFAPCDCIGMIGPCMFYIMDRVMPNEEYIEDSAIQELMDSEGYDDYDDYCKEFGEPDNLGVEFLSTEWGDNCTENVCDFLWKHCIGGIDIHSGNIGQTDYGDWVIFDYSGY